jgi:peptidyl-prolyl cis-trans isomerase C
MQALRNLLREPLWQFLLAGLALFGLSHALALRHDARERRIVIDDALVQYQRTLHHAQLGHYPDAATLEALIQNHIRDEALYREARRLQLDADDSVIRQRLIQKMEFVLTDAVVAQDPDDATLQRFLAEHADRYAQPGRVSFEQRLFAFDDRRADPQARAMAALQQLAGGARAVSADPFALGDVFHQVDADELTRHFGESQMASAPLRAPLGQWSGPYQSGYGWHLIRVGARDAPTPLAFAQIREQLRTDWSAAAREQDKAWRVAALVGEHDIVRLDRQTAQ